MWRYTGVALVAVAVGVVPATAGERGKPKNGASREFTLGLVQKELRAGLSQADVAERLGAPNIVARDADGREAWVYDKVSSEVDVSGSSLGLGGLGSGAGSSVGGLLGIAAGKRSERAKSSQKTLTVVIRFSAAGAVESFTWHDSRF
jgi:hypothetical protein